jgi:hypothetical protein
MSPRAVLVLFGFVLVVSTGCQPAPPGAPAPQAAAPLAAPPPPPSVIPPAAPPPQAAAANNAPAANAFAPGAALPDDPVEIARQSLAALREKVQLISSVHDLDSAKAVAGTFPAASARHRQLSDKLGNRLLTDDVRQQIETEIKPEEQELGTSWAKEYHRVAFIPGAWENMHPELMPYADMTVLPEDADGLEREAVRMLTQAIELSRQVTDANKAAEVSPRYRVATCRLSPVLTKLNLARGGSGAREVHSDQIRGLRLAFDAERKRASAIEGAYAALVHGEQSPAGGTAAAAANRTPSSGLPAEIDQILGELRSAEIPRIRNGVIRLGGMKPGPGREAVGAELLKLLEFEPVRGSAVEAMKQGWLGLDQIPELRDALGRLQDRGLRYSLAEGMSRIDGLDQESIAFLATIFDESPGDAVRVLRNLGPAAEPVVHPYAASPSAEVRKAVCEVLRDIGTEASLTTLQGLTEDGDRGVADKAREAIREIGKPTSQRPYLRDRQYSSAVDAIVVPARRFSQFSRQDSRHPDRPTWP